MPPSARGLSARADGWPARLMSLCHRALARLSGGRAGLYVYLLCAQPIGDPGGPRLRADPGASVRRIEPDDPLQADFPRPAAVQARRYAAGAECWALSLRGRFAGHIWIQRHAYDEDEVRCRYVLPGPECVWDFDVYVPPELRAGRALARLWQGVDDALAAQGVRWSCSRISLFNPASVRAHERLGARHVGTVGCLVLGPVQITLGPHRPRLHIGSTAKPGPSVQISPPFC
jgi:hypothetical protein